MRAPLINSWNHTRTETDHTHPTHPAPPHAPAPDDPAPEAAASHAPRRPAPHEPRHAPTRSIAERVVDRAAHLRPAERDLLRAVYAHGQPVAQIARLADACPVRLRRRVRALTRRVLSPAFALTVLQHPRWPKERRAVAWCIFVDGLSLRDASQRLGMSLHAVRRHASEVRALASHSTAPQPAPRTLGGAA